LRETLATISRAERAFTLADRFASAPQESGGDTADVMPMWKKQPRQNRDDAQRLAEQVLSAK
jgi:hypothetical protein